MENYIAKVNENVKLEEGKIVIQNMLINIYFSDGASTKELARKNSLPLPLISAIKRECMKSDILVQERGVKLTEKGKSLVEKQLG